MKKCGVYNLSDDICKKHFTYVSYYLKQFQNVVIGCPLHWNLSNLPITFHHFPIWAIALKLVGVMALAQISQDLLHLTAIKEPIYLHCLVYNLT